LFKRCGLIAHNAIAPVFGLPKKLLGCHVETVESQLFRHSETIGNAQNAHLIKRSVLRKPLQLIQDFVIFVIPKNYLARITWPAQHDSNVRPTP